MPGGSGYAGSDLVFLVGCPRSGTAWLHRLLASHPRIHTGNESHMFNLYVGPQLRAWRTEMEARRGGPGVKVGLACYFHDGEFQRALKRYTLDLLQPMIGELQPGEIFVERTPSHALFISEIVELLPESRFVHIVRDGRDVVASLLAASKSFAAVWAPHKARDAAGLWVQHVQAVQQAAQGLPREQLRQVRYEELHGAGLDVLRSLFDWLGLPWGDADIQQALEGNKPEALRVGRGTPIPLGGEFSGLYGPRVKLPKGFVRKARPGTWREDLSMTEKVWVWLVARRMMAEMGYPWAAPW